jgi:exopolyphosphatase/guanosine-5'-triphosphate,3'-diphosphate pyrophosphatase
MEIGIIDIGSNSIKLLIGKRDQSGCFQQSLFKVEEKRIGEGMTRDPPRILEADIEKAVEAIKRLHQTATRHGLANIKIVATSAVRDASNQSEFSKAIFDATGIPIVVLSGDDEARLIGKGAMQDPGLSDLRNFVLIDLGGGSMECIQFENREQTKHQSFNLGAVRLASTFVQDREKPLPKKSEDSIADHVLEALSQSPITPDPEIKTAVLTGGASSILDSVLLGQSAATSDTISELQKLCREICLANFEERVTKLGIPNERADIFPAAATIIRTALEYLQCDTIRFTRFNLRAGLIAGMLGNEVG